jgi:hypothetical protein
MANEPMERGFPHPKKRVDFREAARGNCERHLGDVAGESPDDIYDQAYTLAFDGAKEAGADDAEARRVARDVAMDFANP